MYPVEISLDDLKKSYDWIEVFGEGDGGNTTRDVESYDGTSRDEVCLADVVEVIAAVNGENDEANWAGVFLLKDGRFLAAVGYCDYTGWDCHANNNLTVGSTLESVVAFGLGDEDRERLNMKHLLRKKQ